ncbi:hypothetical protein M2171_006964 [Bradyrhizobium japonicum USDA 38]|nr:hypothetical protein [Bradyrhizobium japonicum USDA 38]MCS3940885.1 hypothetical protein [Bradyrhizobium japonicum]MCW2217058.1 hypothetical protein [Bradyrhizobium japonicum]MCW2341674.1 hypothetical protein [Bradyrhizobium japonicum]
MAIGGSKLHKLKASSASNYEKKDKQGPARIGEAEQEPNRHKRGEMLEAGGIAKSWTRAER